MTEPQLFAVCFIVAWLLIGIVWDLYYTARDRRREKDKG